MELDLEGPYVVVRRIFEGCVYDVERADEQGSGSLWGGDGGDGRRREH